MCNKNKQGLKIYRVQVYLTEKSARGWMQLHKDANVSWTGKGKNVTSTKGSLIIESCKLDNVQIPFVVQAPRRPPAIRRNPQTSSWDTLTQAPGDQPIEFAKCVFKRSHLSAVAMCWPIAGCTDYVPLTNNDLHTLVRNEMR